MYVALVGVFAAAICAGSATVLQAMAVRKLPTQSGLDPSMLLRLARNPRYLLAFALLVANLAFSLAALRTLPLFVVQAGRASSLAVTAGLSVALLAARLRRTEYAALAVVLAGLVLLALTATTNDTEHTETALGYCLLGSLGVIVLVALVVLRLPVGSGTGLAVLAGLCFAVLAACPRTLPSLDPFSAITHPSGWAMGLAALLGLLLNALALQRASVVAATATTVATETLVSATVGIVLFGDRTAPGLAAVSIAGFVLALGGSLALARFGAPAEDELTHSTSPPDAGPERRHSEVTTEGESPG
jgi:drug/metabolite transporter (DMT)-like permease